MKALFVPDLSAEWERIGLFMPVAFGAGAAFYFSHGPDGQGAPALALAGLACILAFIKRHEAGLLLALILFAAALSGFGWASLRTAATAAPMIERVVPPGMVEGVLVDVEPRSDGSARWTLAITAIARIPPDAWPEKVRLTVPEPDTVQPGSHIRVKAILFPPRGPDSPGGYDARFFAYFGGIGATGRALAAATTVPAGSVPLPGLMRFKVAVLKVRLAVAARIEAVLPARTTGFAIALLTGLRGQLDVATRDALRASGLGHVLAISGLHMAIVAGGVFWTARLCFAALPVRRRMFPAKTLAAILALVASTGYLVLSGAAISSQRAFVMLAVMFIAIIFGRSAITLRNVALAAMVVLIMTPEAVLSAGFQMSFAATIALIAGYLRLNPLLFGMRETARPAWLGGLCRSVTLFFLGLIATSVLAGLATAPFAAFHFNRVAVYGLLANVLAMPVVTCLVMPAGMVGLIAIPFGLEILPLRLMALGLDYVTRIADWVAGLPDAVYAAASWPVSALVLIVAAAGGLAIMKRPPFAILALIAMAAIIPVNANRRPDILINPTGSIIAVRADDGSLRFLRARGSGFARQMLLRRDGDPRLPADPTLRDGATCDKKGCAMTAGAGDAAIVIANSQHPSGLLRDCRHARLIITQYQPSADQIARCRAMATPPPHLETPDRRAASGAIALYFDADGIRRQISTDPDRKRPWQ